MTSLWLDLRYALRMMARAPGLTVVLVLTLALGIGATTTIFSVVSSVILRPLPYAAPDQLMRIYTDVTDKGVRRVYGMSMPAYTELRQGCPACAELAAWFSGAASVSGGERPQRVQATYTTLSLSATLGVAPALGRWFDASEEHPGDPTVAVLGHELWQRTFHGDPAVIGRRILVDAVPVTVIGVMPRGFAFPARAELWLPAQLDPAHGYDTQFNLGVVARLTPGTTRATLQAVLDARSLGWEARIIALVATRQLPTPSIRARAIGFHDDLVGSLGTALWLLQGAVMFVLLIAIVNVANLLLARSETRTREVAVRHALGASRPRLVRQFLTESVLLGLTGGGLGVLVAMWSLDGVAALIPRAAPRSDVLAVDATTVVFAVVCAFAAALVFGLVPILHARRTDLHGALKDGSPRMTGGRTRQLARRGLVVAEVALAVVLLVGCTAMVRSFLRLQRVELGFAPDHLLTFGLEIPEKTYPAGADAAFWHRLLERVRALPGVRAATLIDELPLASAPGGNAIELPGRSPSGPDEPDWIVDFSNAASEELTEALGARLVHGRGFLRSDTPDTPLVAVVNEAFAAKYFRGREPIGQRVKYASGGQPDLTVVGVVADIRQVSPDRAAGTELFRAVWQLPAQDQAHRTASSLSMAVRTTGDPASLVPVVQRAVAELDPTLPVFGLRTMEDLAWEAIARPRFLTFLLTAFAGLALALAAVGIYGVMAHTVAQRTHEIGLRVALGARPAQVRAMVVRQAAALVALGVAIGLGSTVILSAALDATMRDVFYGAPLAQPAMLAAVALAVTATALLATWVPARRATLVEPTIALRSE